LPLDAYCDWFLGLPIRAENREKIMFLNASTLLGL